VTGPHDGPCGSDCPQLLVYRSVLATMQFVCLFALLAASRRSADGVSSPTVTRAPHTVAPAPLTSYDHFIFIALSSRSHITFIELSYLFHLTLISLSFHYHLIVISLSSHSHSHLILISFSSDSHLILISLSSHSHLSLPPLPRHRSRPLMWTRSDPVSSC
jgi:hypothetical protein